MLALLPLLLDASQGPRQIAITEALSIPPVSVGGRIPVAIDAVQNLIVQGRWTPAREGGEIVRHDGQKVQWAKVSAGQDGWFSGRALSGGYVAARVDSPRRRVMLLEAAGHGMVYVNGEPRGGDPYGYGYHKLPIELREGPNEFVFQVSRGRLRANLVEGRETAQFVLGDPTLPDLLEPGKTVKGAVIVTNNTDKPLRDLVIEATVDGEPVRTPVPTVLPLSMRKAGFDIHPKKLGAAGEVKMALRLILSGRELDVAILPIRRRLPTQSHRRTFVSEIDGSVQYYGVQPRMARAGKNAEHPLVLSLHGASVEAMGQADAYAPNPWATIVAPTNRRPYGFDWEDWGRLDALEVMKDAEKILGGRFVALTGHSMGGHGTWHLGVTFPGLFGAIGPSAGWVSFFSYGGGRRFENADPIEALVNRATNPSDTLSLAPNLRSTGVYILHGDADDNVPVTEARAMAARLRELAIPFGYHEQPGAGHWWENSDVPGAECVDWPPMFDLFARHRTDRPLRRIEFVTATPSVSSRNRWVRVLQQEKAFEFSRADLQFDPHKGRIVGKTENVASLALDLHGRAGLDADIDGQKFRMRKMAGEEAVLRKENGRWAQVGAVPSTEKNPDRGGPFKHAFGRRMVFVYGTRGSVEENAWSLAKARFDAENFTYRGNATPEVLADFEAEPARTKDRSLILYGNERTNSAFARYLAGSPVAARDGVLAAGDRELKGSIALVASRPRADSATAMIGIVGGTDLVGMRLTDRLPYFVSGVGYPDWMAITPGVLVSGNKGIAGAGFFDNSWRFDPSQSAFR